MIEHLVDTAIAALLAAVPGLKVVVGMEDNDPPLATPYCVVHSVVQQSVGNPRLYILLSTVEYNSISGQDAVAGVETSMTAIDDALNSSPAPVTTGLAYLAWEGIDRTQQLPADRRANVREFKAFAQLLP